MHARISDFLAVPRRNKRSNRYHRMEMGFLLGAVHGVLIEYEYVGFDDPLLEGERESTHLHQHVWTSCSDVQRFDDCVQGQVVQTLHQLHIQYWLDCVNCSDIHGTTVSQWVIRYRWAVEWPKNGTTAATTAAAFVSQKTNISSHLLSAPGNYGDGIGSDDVGNFLFSIPYSSAFSMYPLTAWYWE